MQEIISTSSTPPIMSLVNRLQTTSTPLADDTNETTSQTLNNDSSSAKLDFFNSSTKHLNAYNHQTFNFNSYAEYNPNSVAAALQHYTNNSTYGFEQQHHHQVPSIDYQPQRSNWSQVSPNSKSKNFSSSTNTSSSNESDYYNPIMASNYEANNAIASSSNDYNSLVRTNLFPYASSNTANVNTGCYYYHPNAQSVQTPYYTQFLSNTVMPASDSKLRYDSVSSSSSSSSSSSCSSSTSSLLNHLSPINTSSRTALDQEIMPGKKIKLSVVSNLISSVKEENNPHNYQPSSSSSSSVSSSSSSFNSSPLSQNSNNNNKNSSLSPKIVNSMPATATSSSTANSSSIKSLNNISSTSGDRSPSSLGENNSTCSYSQNNMMNSLTSAESYDWMKPVKNQSNGKL